ncbi:phytanoyl-CoA dioxygenase family protein [Dactylosporangium sp. NPDC000244]|uniref:phytanoyl-CoA dioxygenase family protein n=1 Tax=Dactylosporangium sp. NPDC000244 TaxID=3154365 RepID=UPI003324DEB2
MRGTMVGMDNAGVERFKRDGFVKIEAAVPPDVVEQCAELLWAQIDAEPGDPTTWTKPVYWVGGMAQEPFRAAANQPVLTDAFDALVGPGRWRPRASIGSFPLRFPHPEEPDDAGWHIEGSFSPPGRSEFWADVRSRGRALLLLFLFTDVDERNAPTRVRVGSHMDIPPLLAPFGEDGASIMDLGPRIDAVSAHRDQVLATGRAGDVFLCHPFLVHAAQPHHGDRPRFLGQPPLEPVGPYPAEGPVAETIRAALS